MTATFTPSNFWRNMAAKSLVPTFDSHSTAIQVHAQRQFALMHGAFDTRVAGHEQWPCIHLKVFGQIGF